MDTRTIDEVIADFNFEKVHRVMEFLKWEWAGRGVPDVPEMKRVARELLEDLNHRPDVWEMRTGGFEASKDKSHGYYLQFIVEES